MVEIAASRPRRLARRGVTPTDQTGRSVDAAKGRTRAPFGGRVAARHVVLATLLVLAGTACGGHTPTGTAGSAGVGDTLFPALGNGGYDVTHYDLDLDYVPETNRLKGSAVITARATKDLSRFDLDFTGMQVRGATVDGATAHVTRDGAELTLTPDKPIGKGRTFRTAIEYDGVPRTIEDDEGAVEGWVETDDGVAALGEPTGSTTWFPGNHHPSDKATYDITVAVPRDADGDPYDVVSNGELVAEEDRGNRVVRHWRTEEPMASYLATVAVGTFAITRTRTSDGLPVHLAVDPDEAQAAEGIEELVPEVVDWASERFGPYPFSSTGAVVDHLPGLGYALETQTKPYFDSAPDETLVVHELAHQWFGDSVTPREWKDMWLNEGFATYAEWLWQEDRGGRTAGQTFASFYDGTHPESEGIWDFPPADPPGASEVSAPPVYGRGAMTLHTVREAVGDEAFFSILRTWTERHRHGNADTAQFIALCEKISGKDLTALFTTWLREEGRPDIN
ncbi:Peptidase family M1 [Streptomyces misionensis]|uniref:Aminopeptidase N n=1 Tax=Streptomyces misionensis TaxID=67331 RepID=A0A1H5EQR7_9ACTN|nr:Peptidase family M1 [Streptomyces misionensis]